MILFDKISKILKQKAPFILIDRILEIEPGKRIVALKNISGCEPFSSLHFPGNAVFPGAFIIEAAAQAAAVLCHMSEEGIEEEDPHSFFALGGIQQFLFIKPVRPGDCLIIHVNTVKMVEGMSIVKVEIKSEGGIVAKGQMSFGVVKNGTVW